jgi:hypothetical protein
MRSALLLRADRTARAVRAVVAQAPYVAPGHFYSPLTSPHDVRRVLGWANTPIVDMAESSQLAFAAKMRQVMEQPPPGPRYVTPNTMYGPSDAAVYRGMLDHLRPARIIQVGSGYSTAVALDEAEAAGFSDLEITCIEPFPDRLLGLLTAEDHYRVTLLRQQVQDTAPAMYACLGDGDVLFIDSTHRVKAGSDVVWLILHILPRLAPGVVVHLRDLFWPFEYLATWLREQRDWTEDYRLHAFLIGNASWKIMLFSSWLWRCHHPERVSEHLVAQEPSSICLRRVH